jgi:hypothetical protein
MFYGLMEFILTVTTAQQQFGQNIGLLVFLAGGITYVYGKRRR